MARNVVMPATISVRTLWIAESNPKSFFNMGVLYYGVNIYLEGPFDTGAGSDIEAFVFGEVVAAVPAASEVVGKFYFTTNHEVVAAEVLADVVPNLRFAEDDQLGVVPFQVVVNTPVDVLAPHIEEAAEGKTFHTKEVLHTPHEGELDGDVAYFVERTLEGRFIVEIFLAADAFVHQFEGEGVGVFFVVEEILDTEEPGIAGELAAIPFNVEA